MPTESICIKRLSVKERGTNKVKKSIVLLQFLFYLSDEFFLS